jgi:carboxymethylenebutenolidase
VAQTLNVESSGGSMGLYEAEPQGEARGAIVVLQEAFGVNGHIEDVCGRFAAAGYRAVAPHLFHRSGDAVIDYEDMQTVVEHIMQLSADGLEADLTATLGHLAGAGFAPPRVGVVGFCMGGSVSLLAAARHQLGAAVTFYGGGVAEGRFGMPALVDLAPELQTPWLGLFGDRDESIPPADVEQLRAALTGAPVETDIVRYADAEHGFHCDARESYNADAAADAWKRTLEWFGRHLGARSSRS